MIKLRKNTTKFGKEMKIRRLFFGFRTITALSKEIKVPYHTLWQHENSDRPQHDMSCYTAWKLSKALCWSLDHMIEMMGKKKTLKKR